MESDARIRTGVLSCWARPMQGNLTGGAALWSLSALCARQHFERLVLFADSLGKQWLVEELGLPFDEVVQLDISERYQSLAWASAKLTAYHTMAARGEPFLHLDGDVVLLKPVPERVLTAPLAAERPATFGPPEPFIDGLTLPPSWRDAYQRGHKQVWACGIAGGTATERIAEWASEALSVTERNCGAWPSVISDEPPATAHSACRFIEEWSLSLRFRPEEVGLVFPTAHVTGEQAAEAGYVHLNGQSKQQPEWQARVERELSKRFPKQAERIASIARPVVGN